MQRPVTVRIAYVTETFPPEINGVALTAERTVRYLRGAGHAVQLLRPRQAGEAALDSDDEWRTAGGPIPLYPELRFGHARVAELRRRFGGDGSHPMPDLVHVATPGPLGWAALRAARAEGIPTSADFRTNFQAYSRHYRLGWFEPLVWRYLLRLHAMADATFAPTAEMAARLQAAGVHNVQVVGRGVDAMRFAPAWRDRALRRSWGADDDDAVLLSVGRLAPEKNVEMSLDSYERLRQVQPRLRMVVVGDGPLRKRLQAEHPTAHFVGVQRGSDLARHYASADVFLFPSLTETFGNVTLEAMASGLAVAAFDTAAAGQLLRDGVSGWLAPMAAVTANRNAAADAAAFIAAAQRALTTAQPQHPLRHAAVQVARGADWNSVLRGFEQRLCRLASPMAGPLRHAALA